MKKFPDVEIPSDFLPKREEYLNSQQLVIECKKQNTPLSRKSIHNYIKDNLLPKPLHVAQEALFHKQYILDEIKAIHILKSLFHVSYDYLKELSLNRHVSFRKIVSDIYSLQKYLQENNLGKARGRPFLLNIANDEILQRTAAAYLEEIKKGANPEEMDIRAFINEVLGPFIKLKK